MEPSKSVQFDSSLRDILDHLGIHDECQRALLPLRVHSIDDLKRVQSLLEKTASGKAGATLSLGPKPAKVLLRVLEYLKLFVGSKGCEARLVVKGENFLYWLRTGIVETSCPLSESNGEHKEARPPKNDQRKPRSVQSKRAPGIDSTVQITEQVAPEASGEDDKLDQDELKKLLAEIKNSSWGHDSEHGVFYFQPQPEFNLPPLFFNILYDYQRDGIEWMANRFVEARGCILADEPGLGKTIQSLGLVGMLMRAKTIGNALVVVPPHLANNWKKEAEEFLRMIVPGVQIHVVGSGNGKKGKIRRLILKQAQKASLDCSTNEPPYLIIATSSLVRDHANEFKQVRNCKWGILISDEAHHLKNPEAKVTKAFKNLSKWVMHIVLLTGTPVPNRYEELWYLCGLVSDKLIGSKKKFLEFVKPLSKPSLNENDERAAGIRRLELQNELENVVLRRTKEVKQAYPRLNVSIIWYLLNAKQRELYANCCASKSDDEDTTQFGALQFIQRLRNVANHPLLLQANTDDEGKKLKDIVKELDRNTIIEDGSKYGIVLDLMKKFQREGHCVLIASQWTRTLDILERMLALEGMSLKRIDGNVPPSKRIQIIQSLEEEGIDCLLLTTKSGGEGLNITFPCRVILTDPAWTPSVDEQLIARVHRQGQTRPVEAYYLIAAGTVEEKMIEIQMHKNAIHHSVLSPPSSGKIQIHKWPKEWFQWSPPELYDSHKKQGLAWDRDQQDRLLENSNVHGITHRPTNDHNKRKRDTTEE